jgi:hypothetical protein
MTTTEPRAADGGARGRLAARAYIPILRLCPGCGALYEWSTKRQREFDYNTLSGQPPTREPTCGWWCKAHKEVAR